MKNFLTLVFSAVFIAAAYGQEWKQMMHDPSANIYDVVRAAEAYFDGIDKYEKGSGWKTYQRWLFENEYKYYPSGDRSSVDPYFVKRAYEGFEGGQPESLFSNGWEELGPYYIEQVTGHYSVGLGRVESFFVNPKDTMRLYIGSRSGGFWKSMDGGQTWQGGATDTLIATGVNTISVSPANQDSILINVKNSRNNTTHGIYRSTDGGDTWSLTAFNPARLGWGGLGTNNKIYQIAYHPTVPGKVVIGSSKGLFVSDDDLASWSNPITGFDFERIAFHPTKANIIYATTSDNKDTVYYSTNGGLSFLPSATLPGSTASLRISTTPACPNCVYVASNDGIWKSRDEGKTYRLLVNPNISNYGAFAVSDLDTSIMLFGSIDVNMSVNEGQNFRRATFWNIGNATYHQTGGYVHADIRGAQCIKGTFWINTDGMLAKSTNNGLSWTFYEGQSIRENYRLGVSQSNHYRTICGSQDNGTSIKTQNSWIEYYGADGMEGIIHPLNDDWMVGSTQYGGRRRTKNGGLTQHSATPYDGQGDWVAPLMYDPNNHMRLYHVADTVYRSDDFGNTWTKVGTPGFSGNAWHATIAQNNSDILLATRKSNIEKSLDGGATWNSIRANLPGYAITSIAFDPADDSVIVLCYGRHHNDNAKVFISYDQGASWHNISYNLNNMPIRSVVIDHTKERNIYLGAEIGVYKKAMNDTHWTLYNPDLPNVTVNELAIMRGSNTLRAATWGRGLWGIPPCGKERLSRYSDHRDHPASQRGLP